MPVLLWKYLVSPIGRIVFVTYQFFWATGWLRSVFKGYACNAKGEPMPWLSMPAVEYLESLDLNGVDILELGGGSSTLYFARRGANVVCIEQYPKWRAWLEVELAKLSIHNVKIYPSLSMYMAERDAVGTCTNTLPAFDLLILDDNPHDELLEMCLCKYRMLFKAVLIDNTEVPVHERGKENYFVTYLQHTTRFDFSGFALGNCIQQTTSLYYVADGVYLPKTKSLQPKIHLHDQEFK